MPKNQLGMQISYFRYADMDFFKMPHIQIKDIWGKTQYSNMIVLCFLLTPA